MREKWFTFKNISVFDHETKKFWHRREIKELAKVFWDDAEMNDITKRPTNEDLAWIFYQEFPGYSDSESHQFWDDCGHWEMIETPHNIGFGIIDGDTKRFHELYQEYKHRGQN